MASDMRNYIKPGDMLDIHRDAAKALMQSNMKWEDLNTATQRFLKTCPVCGARDCNKTIKKANGVYVHQEDVDAAEPIKPEW